MTLQQLEYVLAVEKYRHFVRAAEACQITQSTLSSMIHKLEEELDLVIFDRAAHPVKPTLAGEEFIRQARVVMYHADQLKELSMGERQRVSGTIRVGVTPTVAPYIMPKLFHYIDGIESLSLEAYELHRDRILRMLKRAELDMAIISLPQKDDDLLEIPLYREQLYAYVSPKDELYKAREISCTKMPYEKLWELKNEVGFQKQVADFCGEGALPVTERKSRYESGSVTTLIHIVNANDGFTIIPELHIPLLREEYQKHIRPLVDPVPVREVGLFVRKDYVREGLLNIVAEGIKGIVPERMVDERLRKFAIRL